MEGLPVMFWGLDPLYWTHIKLFAIEILKLPPYPGFQGVFAVSNHPIFRAHLMGYVVSVDRRQKLTIYGVDDGTATIPCCHWIDQDGVPENSQQLNLGDLVSALGKITTFRDRRQITIESICIERDPNSEALHWLEVLKHKELYNKPFEVPVKFNPKAPTTNKHWLHMTPLDGEINELEEEVQKNISDYLESANILSFFIDNLCTVSQLKGKAKLLSSKYDERLKEKYGSDALRDHLKKNASKNATKTIIRPLLRKLEKKGIVYCKNVFNGNFDFISVNEDLAPRILDVIRDVSETEGETSYGVSRSKIIQKLKSLEKYKCVKRDNIISALDNLLASGDIYETKDYHYRLI